ncbi:peroxide stress protein YaaA [Lachnospiraceae bacterium 45-P1]
MKIIISPAKKMEECQDIFAPGDFPRYLSWTKQIYELLKSMTEEELKQLFKANAQITRQNFERYQTMDLMRALTPALLSYVGIQYQYMAPKLFSNEEWEYVNSYLRILSGFYGILKPSDRVTPYRLEMQTKLSAGGKKDLYEFWGRKLYDAIGDSVIINLASREYSRAVEPYLTRADRFVTCIFGEYKEDKVKVKATEAKMARGEMVRYMAQNRIRQPENIKNFDRLGYRYSEALSAEDTFIFIKEEK